MTNESHPPGPDPPIKSKYSQGFGSTCCSGSPCFSRRLFCSSRTCRMRDFRVKTVGIASGPPSGQRALRHSLCGDESYRTSSPNESSRIPLSTFTFPNPCPLFEAMACCGMRGEEPRWRKRREGVYSIQHAKPQSGGNATVRQGSVHW